MAKLTTEVREANERNIKTWLEQRHSNSAFRGAVRCTYADIYVPTVNGSVHKIWSIQRAMTAALQADNANKIVIEDCGINELRQDVMERIFGVSVPCRESDYYNPKTLHVGKLTDSVYQFMQSLKVPITSPYVLYDPRRFTWFISKDNIALIGGRSTDNDRSESTGKRLILPAILAAVAAMID